MTQVMVEVRRTHTPDSRAESAFSAVARMARPHGERRMNSARAIATIGATIRVSTWPGVKRKPSSVKRQVERHRERAGTASSGG